jgi:hypothetical protein
VYNGKRARDFAQRIATVALSEESINLPRMRFEPVALVAARVDKLNPNAHPGTPGRNIPAFPNRERPDVH